MATLDIPTLVMERYGLTAKKQGREYHSPCPDCGGRDRMIWFDDDKGNGFCRQCYKTFWLTDLKTLDPLEKLEREQRAREYAERQRGLDAQLLTKFQSRADDYLRGWHDAMTYAAREWWHAQGITDETIEYYELGARPYPITNSLGEKLNLIAYTIPIRDPETCNVVNMHYRIDNAPDGFGKYKQEAGLPARSFYCKPHTGGDVIIVEGAKKAMVLNQLLDGACQIVGLPGITPSERLIDELAGYKRKFFLPDPDVTATPIQRFRDRLQNLHVVRLPVKPDDAVTRYGMTREDLRAWLVQYRN